MGTARRKGKQAPASTPGVREQVATRAATRTDWLRVASIVLAIIGLFVAGYLTWAEVTGGETVCLDTGQIDCRAVQESAYAETLGIPVAVMGLLGYVAILAVSVLEDQIPLMAAYGRTLVAGLSLFGVIFQTYLTYIEADVLGKWCQWCVASYIVIAAIFVIAVYRLVQFLQPLRR